MLGRMSQQQEYGALTGLLSHKNPTPRQNVVRRSMSYILKFLCDKNVRFLSNAKV